MKLLYLIRIFLRCLSSGKLALVLVAVLILFSLVGVIFPQKGQLHPQQILQWQQQHPELTTVVEPWGFFTVFHSTPFMISIGLLALNTLTCTVLHFIKRGGFRALTGPGSMVLWGFLLLHLSFIILFTGGLISAAARMDGYILLTEGQTFIDRPENYLRYARGLIQLSDTFSFSVTLDKADIKFEKPDYVVDMNTILHFRSVDGQTVEGSVQVNRPYVYEGKAFTLDEIGYSPRLILRHAGKQTPLVNSFVALQTVVNDEGRQYRDYLPLPFFEKRIIVELYPNGNVDAQSDKIFDEPVIILTAENSKIDSDSRLYLPLGQKTVFEGCEFEFPELRQWASFRVSSDPGYPVVWFALWLGLAALLLRYLPELREWRTKPIGYDES
jgi:cytochrome c biogenesis protein ResB